MLLLHDGRICAIVEIEETDIKPTQVCGKFLTSALASHFIHQSDGNHPLAKSGAVLFVQVVDAKDLHKNSVKPQQLERIAEAIREKLPFGGIAEYQLFLVNGHQDQSGVMKVVKCVTTFCERLSHEGRQNENPGGAEQQSRPQPAQRH